MHEKSKVSSAGMFLTEDLQGWESSNILPLDVDSINENDSVANPDPTPRIASVHKS